MNRSGERLRSSSGRLVPIEDDLAGEYLTESSRLPIETAQDIDQAIGRDRFERDGRSEQHRVRHRRACTRARRAADNVGNA